MENQFPASLSSLLCTEDGGFLNEGGGEEEGEGTEEEDVLFSVHSSISNIEDEYIEMLVKKEASLQNTSPEDLSIGNWLQRSRLDAVRWILEMREFLGLRFQTAYLSVSYLDRFLCRRSVDKGKSWAIWLLTMACLSLAAKMEEDEVPPLSKFRVEGFDFQNKVIRRAELLVLDVLEWRMSSITPFAFLSYFANKLCDQPKPKGLLSNAIEVVAAATEVMNVTEHLPSAVAAAAILVASNRQLTKKSVEVKMGMTASSESSENVFSCYKLMWELELEKKLRTSEIQISQEFSFVQWSPNSQVAAGCKRKLAFDDDAHDS